MKVQQFLIRANQVRIRAPQRPAVRTAVNIAPIRDEKWDEAQKERRSKAILRAVNTAKELKAPNETFLRMKAEEAAKLRRSCDRIERFGKIQLTYCGLALGYTDRTTVAEYYYLGIKRQIEERRQKLAQEVERRVLVLGLNARLQRSLFAMRKDPLKCVTDDDIVHFCDIVYREIVANILAMAKFGRRLKRRSIHGYACIKAMMGERSGRICFLIVDEFSGREPVVVGLQTPGKFNRCNRRRFNHRENMRYTNRPKRLLH